MNIISFDVGIKNMAYCILMKDVSENTLSIQKWDVLNLMDIEEPTKLCACMNKPKTKKTPPTICNKSAKYVKHGQYYCEKHAKSSNDFFIPTKTMETGSLKKLKHEQLLTIGNSHSVFANVETPSKLKKAELLEKIDGFFREHCFEFLIAKKSKTANETELIQIGRNMKTLLNVVINNQTITHVVIENQISPIANRMKTIQGMLAQYFIMINENIHIEFVSSSNKLNQFQKTAPPVLENTLVTNDKYKKHKIDGVSYCSKILENNPMFSAWSLDKKKKDDLADAFLQGLWYLKNKNIITYAEDLKINII